MRALEVEIRGEAVSRLRRPDNLGLQLALAGWFWPGSTRVAGTRAAVMMPCDDTIISPRERIQKVSDDLDR